MAKPARLVPYPRGVPGFMSKGSHASSMPGDAPREVRIVAAAPHLSV
jgi:hypothetical protein